MTPRLIDLIRNLHWYAVDEGGPVIEVGALIESGQDHLDVRRAFPHGTPFVGVDVVPGPGVDRVADLLDTAAMEALVDEIRPRVVLCLYVLEHVWETARAARSLAAMWRRNPESWLWVSSHQNQPYHGTGAYGDFHRFTADGFKRLFDEAGVDGTHVLVSPDSSNPEDVVLVRQPASRVWSSGMFDAAARVSLGHWEQYA